MQRVEITALGGMPFPSSLNMFTPDDTLREWCAASSFQRKPPSLLWCEVGWKGNPAEPSQIMINQGKTGDKFVKAKIVRQCSAKGLPFISKTYSYSRHCLWWDTMIDGAGAGADWDACTYWLGQEDWHYPIISVQYKGDENVPGRSAMETWTSDSPLKDCHAAFLLTTKSI